MDKIKYITPFDEEYPDKLRNIDNSPEGIYIKGSLPNKDAPCVAIVGSRVCSEYGKAMAKEFAKELAKNNVSIISGMARGIDGIAQEAAINAGGKSYGILGCGIDVVYPISNKRLYERVVEKGGLITEYPPGREPLPHQFPQRNRIISALSDIVLVIEAKKRSGTSITVSRALEQGKDIFAVPGRLYDACSEGCNELISQGAGIAISPDIILKALGVDSNRQDSNAFRVPKLTKNEKKVLSVISFSPVSIDYIQNTTEISLQELFEILFNLQLKEIIIDLGQGNYIKKAPA